MYLVIIISLLLLHNNSLAQNKKIDFYYEELMFHYTLLENQFTKFETTIWNKNATTSQLIGEYKLTVNICKYNGSLLNEIKNNPRDKYFLLSVKQFYRIVNNTLKNEYKQIIEIYTQKQWHDFYSIEIFETNKIAIKKINEKKELVIECQKKFLAENSINPDY